VTPAFLSLIALAAFAASGIASVAGFGIGSILTPLIAWKYGMKEAVTLVSIPHFAATLLRFWRLRNAVDRHVLLSFGIINAAGALAGALLHKFASSPALGAILALLLIFVGLVTMLGYSERLRFGGSGAWIAGAVSGGFGGLVGNQGGLRGAAMLGLGVRKEAFVATATAIGLMVDTVRMPVYFFRNTNLVMERWLPVSIALAAVLAGTVAGGGILKQIPETVFKRVVGGLLCVMGILVFASLGAHWHVAPSSITRNRISSGRGAPVRGALRRTRRSTARRCAGSARLAGA